MDRSAHRRTRIVATIGPASDTHEQLLELIRAGVDVFRVSASHDPIDVVCARIAAIRTAGIAAAVDVAVMVDLCGPKLRCVPGSSTSVVAGDVWTVHSGASTGTARDLGSTVPAAAWEHIPAGTCLAIGDGALRFEVLASLPHGASCRALTSGTLTGRPGLHVPSDVLSITAPTTEDYAVIDATVAAGVDAIAVSFVSTAADIHRVRARAREQLIVAKIETAASVRDLDAIIEAADAVMVARGDLGLEFPLADVPFLQRRIIRAATAAGRPVITATQMLESMVTAPVPTRAEAADVATAVLDGTSAVMLSAETAVGVNPVHTVATMAALAARADVEIQPRTELPLPQTGNSTTATVTHAVSGAAHLVAAQTGAVAVVGLTDSGLTARALSRWRSPLPLIAATRSPRTLRQLRFAWGVHAVLVHSPEVDDVLDELVAAGVVPPDVQVVVVSGTPGGRASDTVRVRRTPSLQTPAGVDHGPVR